MIEAFSSSTRASLERSRTAEYAWADASPTYMTAVTQYKTASARKDQRLLIETPTAMSQSVRLSHGLVSKGTDHAWTHRIRELLVGVLTRLTGRIAVSHTHAISSGQH